MSELTDRTACLIAQMTVEALDETTRYVVLEGVAVGRLLRDDLGRWSCEWRSTRGWERCGDVVEPNGDEAFETLAVEEVAGLLALEEHGRSRGWRI
jgi:hypothetical protein